MSQRESKSAGNLSKREIDDLNRKHVVAMQKMYEVAERLRLIDETKEIGSFYGTLQQHAQEAFRTAHRIMEDR